MNQVRGIFFDLHGTLLLSADVNIAWCNWAKAIYMEFVSKGADLGFDEFEIYLNNLFESDAPEYDEPGFTLFMRRVKELSLRLGLKVESAEIRPMVDRLVRLWHDGMYLDYDAESLLKALREKYVIGLITNWEHSPRIFELVDELGLHDYFDSIVVSDDVKFAKPDPRIFQVALCKHGLLPSETIYVGDMDVDVTGALAAGIKPVLIRRIGSNGVWDPYTNKNSGNYDSSQVTVIRSLVDLLDLLVFE